MKIALQFTNNIHDRLNFESQNSLANVAIDLSLLIASATFHVIDLGELAACYEASEPDAFELLLIGQDQNLWVFEILNEEGIVQCTDGSKLTPVNSQSIDSQVEQSRFSLPLVLASMSPALPKQPPLPSVDRSESAADNALGYSPNCQKET